MPNLNASQQNYVHWILNISERTEKFRYKIFINSGLINVQI